MASLNNKKQEPPQLGEQIASQMLDNIFDACNVETNHVPLTIMTSNKNYQRGRFHIQKILLVFILFFFCLFPLLFITPSITLAQSDDRSVGAPTYELTVASIVPVSEITAVIDGNAMPIYQTARNIYSIEPNKNGTMTITVLLANSQSAQSVTSVENVDTQSPVVVSNRKTNDLLILELSDDTSGIDYKNIYGLNLNGDKLFPTAYDPRKGSVTFKFPESSINIYIPDFAGNQLHLILTIQ